MADGQAVAVCDGADLAATIHDSSPEGDATFENDHESFPAEGRADHCFSPGFAFAHLANVACARLCCACCASAEQELGIKLLRVLHSLQYPDLNAISRSFHAGIMPEDEVDPVEVGDMRPPLSTEHWLWGNSDAQCSPYGFVHCKLWQQPMLVWATLLTWDKSVRVVLRSKVRPTARMLTCGVAKDVPDCSFTYPSPPPHPPPCFSSFHSCIPSYDFHLGCMDRSYCPAELQ